MDLGIKGRRAIVTGGTTGIGFAVANRLLEEGVDVLITGRDQQRLAAALRRLSTVTTGTVLGVAADVVKPKDVERIHRMALSEFGGVDILFNNAGLGSGETIQDAPDARWQYYWDLHVMAALRLSRLCCATMERKRSGVIINNASICAVQPIEAEPIHAVTKAALMMLGKCMANEYIAKGIRVNTINPGPIQTPAWVKKARRSTKGKTTWQGWLEEVAVQFTTIGRFGTAEELADFVVFLASPRASYCVGASFYVDGGMLRTVS